MSKIKQQMTYGTINDCQVIEIPKIRDLRGNLAVIENNMLPFEMHRVYYLFDVPAGAYRGGHAHKNQQEFLIAISGSFQVILDDGFQKKIITLNRPDRGLLIPTGIWRELQDFSQGSVCLVINSNAFDESDYIRDYQAFLNFKQI
jgi:dTDP-4-dehydrorhamnose 3,5-epimerase-like enzyme